MFGELSSNSLYTGDLPILYSKDLSMFSIGFCDYKIASSSYYKRITGLCICVILLIFCYKHEYTHMHMHLCTYKHADNFYNQQAHIFYFLGLTIA